MSVVLDFILTGKGHFICKGKTKHILRLDIPDGNTAENFSKIDRCPKCDSELFWAEEFDH